MIIRIRQRIILLFQQLPHLKRFIAFSILLQLMWWRRCRISGKWNNREVQIWRMGRWSFMSRYPVLRHPMSVMSHCPADHVLAAFRYGKNDKVPKFKNRHNPTWFAISFNHFQSLWVALLMHFCQCEDFLTKMIWKGMTGFKKDFRAVFETNRNF